MFRPCRRPKEGDGVANPAKELAKARVNLSPALSPDFLLDNAKSTADCVCGSDRRHSWSLRQAGQAQLGPRQQTSASSLVSRILVSRELKPPVHYVSMPRSPHPDRGLTHNAYWISQLKARSIPDC
jgi:hypothetical protein